MDPSGNNNGNNGKSSNADNPGRLLQRRLVAAARRPSQQRGEQRLRPALRQGVDPRPEEAPSSMANRRSRLEAAAAAADPPAVAAAADRSRSSDEDNSRHSGDNNNNDNPKLRELLQHLRESGHATAISMEKARNVLEACGGNVALAGELFWEDHFASEQQQHHPHHPPPPPLQHPNLPPLDAPSAAAEPAAPADPQEEMEDEERRVRRRLESDFERLLPAPEQNNNPIAEIAVRRRRRRRRRGPEQPAEGGEMVLPAMQRNNNNRHNVEEEVLMAPDVERAARPPPRQPPRRPEDNQALFVAARAVLGAGEDAAEGSVSVSDDEAGVAGVLRMVRESGRARLRGRRRRRSASSDEDERYVRARSALNNAQIQAAEAAEEEERMDVKNRRGKTGACGGHGGGGGSDGEDSSDDDEDKKNNPDSDDDAYLSDNDWMFTASSRESTSSSAPSGPSNSQPTENLRAPLSVLWNELPPAPDVKKSAKKKMEDNSKKDKDEEASGRSEQNPAKKLKVDGKKKEDGDGEGDDDDDNNNDPPIPGAAKRPEIPSTWLHASFSPHSTSMGLAIKDPKPEDVAEHSWRLQQISNDASANNSSRRNNAIPLPYHCRGITAILSIVTAAMYTGASVQSNQVTCSSSRVPFVELPEELRKREFESRLIDALSSLIFIAAKASMERKKKALTKRQARKNRKRKRQAKKKETAFDEEDTEVPDILRKNLERKLKLCPVVFWKEGSQNAPTPPAQQWEDSLDDSAHTGPRIQMNITYGSNIADIRAFVLSNMQSFTSPGGLALLLETIVGIHGEGAVKKMLRKAHEASANPKEHSCFLVRCTCEARQKIRLQESQAARRKMTNSLDTTPPGHECVSTELISLLLTGKVHSSLKGWTTGPLGFGLLSNKSGEMGRALTRPELPVWCIKGETCYSVLLLDHTNHGENLDEKAAASSSTGKDKEKAGKKKKSLSPSKPKAAPRMKIAVCSSTSRSRDFQETKAFASKDQPGYIANMTHWNSWYGVRNLSGLRLITARPKWSPPAPSWVLAQYKSAPHAKHSMSLTCERRSIIQQLQERRFHQANVVSSDEREGAKSEPPVDEAAMDRVRHHPEDAKYYPKEPRRWRFDMRESAGDKVAPNSKPRGNHWVPYHSLTRAEQMIVETKFGPQINRILWTRWPGATIDKFTPDGKKLPVV